MEPGTRPVTPRPPAPPRADWLLLCDVDPLPAARDPGVVVRLVRDRAAFRAALLGDRPRVVLVSVPPGGPAEVSLVAGERARRRGMRAVVLNDRSCVEERLAALRRGFDEALETGVDRGELLARMTLLADHARATREEHRLAIAPDRVLDLDARELRVAGALVHLRPKEYALLETLARARGRTLTRRELLDRAWGADHDGDPRTVDVHVRWLREKVETDPDHPRRLVTVRGVGYRLTADP